MLDVIVGLDVGSSSIKAVAYSVGGEVVTEVEIPHSFSLPAPGYAELDAGQCWENIKNVLTDLVATGEVNVRSIGFSTACPTSVFLDENFDPLRPAIAFLDNRSAPQLAAYNQKVSERIAPYFEAVGNRSTGATCSVGNLLWVREHEPEVAAKIKYFGLLNSFLVAKLTGEFKVDWTQGSYFGLFNVRNEPEWDKQLLEVAEVAEGILPEIVAPYAVAGRITEEVSVQTGLAAGIPVAEGAGDIPAAAFALGLSTTDKIFESAGTSGVLTFCSYKPEFISVLQNRRHVIPGAWLHHGGNSLSGGSVGWLRKEIFTEYQDISRLEDELENTEPGAKGVVFLPYLLGERCPYWDPQAKGMWYGLTLQTRKIDLLEAVYEGGAFSLRNILERAGIDLSEGKMQFIGTGNATKSAHWNQLKANIVNAEYATCEFPNASAFGAALIGGIAAGIYKSYDDPAIPFLQTTGDSYYPQDVQKRSRYEKNFEKFKQLYEATKDIMHDD